MIWRKLLHGGVMSEQVQIHNKFHVQDDENEEENLGKIHIKMPLW
jgi:hypothetical protein